MIKFLDIYKQDKRLHKKILFDLNKTFIKGDFILGNDVKKFEKNFAKFCNSKFAIGCANGTDALTIALKSLNLKKNSEVIIPAMTYCSTAFSVLNANLKPVLVDTDFLSSTIDIDKIKKKITKKTKVIMPVHLYGSVTNISKIKKLINNKNIFIIDDCAQAHGASDDKGKKVGSIADISTFSLYPGKNLGAYGDAGVITTNSNVINKKIRKIRNLGSEKKFIHDTIGFNSRLDTIQAIILNHKLKNLKKLNQKRKKIAKKYDKFIFNRKIRKIRYSKNCIYHQYVILTKYRSKLIKMFKQKKIQDGFHYPYPIHKLKVFKNYFKAQKFKNSEILAKEGISLPIDPNLSNKEVSIIINTINKL